MASRPARRPRPRRHRDGGQQGHGTSEPGPIHIHKNKTFATHRRTEKQVGYHANGVKSVRCRENRVEICPGVAVERGECPEIELDVVGRDASCAPPRRPPRAGRGPAAATSSSVMRPFSCAMPERVEKRRHQRPLRREVIRDQRARRDRIGHVADLRELFRATLDRAAPARSSAGSSAGARSRRWPRRAAASMSGCLVVAPERVGGGDALVDGHVFPQTGRAITA